MIVRAKHGPLILAALAMPGIIITLCLWRTEHASILNYWPEAVADWIALGIGYALLQWLLGLYPTKVGLIAFAFVTGIITGFISGFGNVFFLRHLQAGELHISTAWIINTSISRYIIFTAAGVIAAVLMATNIKVGELEVRFRRQQDAEILLQEAELLKLRQQLQPHFLFNSLNSISSLILISPEKAQEMIGQLAHFLRLSINRDGREAAPLAEELEYVESYLAIEAIRFGDRLELIFERSGLEEMRIPSHLLQPLVENAIKYGLQCEGKSVPVKIVLQGSPRMLTVIISNPCTVNALPSKGAGFGLEGVRRRLYLLYGRADLLETIATKSSFTATIKIPQHYAPLPDHRR